MTVSGAALVFKAADIIEEGGLARTLVVAPEALFSDAAAEADGALAVGVEFSVGSDAILLQASVSGAWKLPCSRCLKVHSASYAAAAEETFAADSVDIDISATVRDAALLELPQRSLCRPDCRGLCARCGKDLNEAACACPPQDIAPLVKLNRLKE